MNLHTASISKWLKNKIKIKIYFCWIFPQCRQTVGRRNIMVLFLFCVFFVFSFFSSSFFFFFFSLSTSVFFQPLANQFWHFGFLSTSCQPILTLRFSFNLLPNISDISVFFQPLANQFWHLCFLSTYCQPVLTSLFSFNLLTTSSDISVFFQPIANQFWHLCFLSASCQPVLTSALLSDWTKQMIVLRCKHFPETDTKIAGSEIYKEETGYTDIFIFWFNLHIYTLKFGLHIWL